MCPGRSRNCVGEQKRSTTKRVADSSLRARCESHPIASKIHPTIHGQIEPLFPKSAKQRFHCAPVVARSLVFGGLRRPRKIKSDYLVDESASAKNFLRMRFSEKCDPRVGISCPKSLESSRRNHDVTDIPDFDDEDLPDAFLETLRRREEDPRKRPGARVGGREQQRVAPGCWQGSS